MAKTEQLLYLNASGQLKIFGWHCDKYTQVDQVAESNLVKNPLLASSWKLGKAVITCYLHIL